MAMKELNDILNKRKSERLRCLVPVDGKQGDVFDRTQTFDISKGGIGFISAQRIPLNKQIAMAIELAPDDVPVVVVGKVKWVRQISNSEIYRVGMSFEDVLSGSKSRLNQYFMAK